VDGWFEVELAQAAHEVLVVDCADGFGVQHCKDFVDAIRQVRRRCEVRENAEQRIEGASEGALFLLGLLQHKLLLVIAVLGHCQHTRTLARRLSHQCKQEPNSVLPHGAESHE